jgi:hypothetical protein
MRFIFAARRIPELWYDVFGDLLALAKKFG